MKTNFLINIAISYLKNKGYSVKKRPVKHDYFYEDYYRGTIKGQPAHALIGKKNDLIKSLNIPPGLENYLRYKFNRDSYTVKSKNKEFNWTLFNSGVLQYCEMHNINWTFELSESFKKHIQNKFPDDKYLFSNTIKEIYS